MFSNFLTSAVSARTFCYSLWLLHKMAPAIGYRGRATPKSHEPASSSIHVLRASKFSCRSLLSYADDSKKQEPLKNKIEPVHVMKVFPDWSISIGYGGPKDCSTTERSKYLSKILSSYYTPITWSAEIFKKHQPVAVNTPDHALQWVRGVFLRRVSLETAEVDLVDLGYTVTVHAKSVFPLAIEFSTQMCLSERAFVYGLPKEMLKDEGMDILTEILTVEEHYICAVVTRSKPTFEVQLVLDGIDISFFIRHRKKQRQGIHCHIGSILHASSADDIHVLPHEKKQELDRINELVAEEVREKRPPDLSGSAINAVLFDDGFFYRARLTGLEGSLYRASFIDYGNQKLSPLSGISGLSQTLQKTEVPTNTFTLTDTPVDRKWDIKISDWLIQFIRHQGFAERHCLYELISKDKSGEETEIKIFDDDDQSITGTYILSIPDKFEPEIPPVDIPYSPEASPEKDLMQLQRAYAVKITDISCYQRYEPGVIIPVYPCYVVDPQVIFLVHEDDQQARSVAKMIGELSMGMEKLERLKEIPPEGTLVCARFSIDKRWYRGCILKIEDTNSALVNYVDYGNFEKVIIDDMRPLTDSLSKYPRMAIPAVLYGIKSPQGNFSNDAIDAANELILNKSMLFRILKVNDEDVLGDLLLEDEQTGTRISVAEKFVEMKIAEPRDF